MKKILIIAEYFAPNNQIASIRITKLAKYFKLNANYHITVISKKLQHNEIIDPILNNNLEFVDNHIVLNYSKFMQRILNIQKFFSEIKQNKMDNIGYSLAPNNNKKIKVGTKFLSFIKTNFKIFLNAKFLAFIRSNINDTINHIKAKNFSKVGLKYLEEYEDNYDVVLSSHPPFSAHLISLKIKRQHPNIIWIADFRDPVICALTPPKKYIGYFKKYINTISQKADIITGVSYACIELFEDKCKHKIYTIYNGFDRDDIKNIEFIPNDKFILTYTGTIYNGKQDLVVIFKAISELIIENKIHKSNIIINYAGNSEIYFKQQISKYNLTEIVNIYGMINRQQSLQLQLGSTMLILAAWNNIGETGAISGKFLEYLMINKPIVCAVTGNLANSQLKEMITEANNGIVWEEATNEIDYTRLKAYILDQYERFIKNEPLLFNPNIEYIEQFNYKNIAQQFIDLIENNVKDKNINE